MNKKAVVVSAEAGKLSVLPVAKLECASCSSVCGRKQEPLIVVNPRSFSLHAGDVVIIEQGGRSQAFEGLFSLLFPLCSAVAGYFAAGPFAAGLGGMPADGVRALFVLLFLFVSASLVVLVTRHFLPQGRAEVVSVCGAASGPAAVLHAEVSR